MLEATRDKIRIQMMNDFIIYINEHTAEYLATKTRKGAALVEYLIANKNKPVSNRRLLAAFWPNETLVNPENALKTLVSRVRLMLNALSPNLGACVVADRGAYHWECQPDMEVDMYELDEVFEQLNKPDLDTDVRRELSQKMIALYAGDLLRTCDLNTWALPRSVTMHNQYIAAILAYVEILKNDGNDREIVHVCRRALEVDSFNDKLHMELMAALVNQGRENEAMVQWEEVIHLYYHYLNAEPSPELKEFYNQIIVSKRNIEFSMELISQELMAFEGDKGAFVCEYGVFKEFFNIHLRNAKRMGITIFLGIIMISGPDGQAMESMKQSNTIRGLVEILRTHLRRGDIVTQVSPTIVATLLPMVNYKTGDTVMERIKGIFYRQYPNSNVQFSYRISPMREEKEGQPAQRALE